MAIKFLQVAVIAFIFTLILGIVCALPLTAATEYFATRDEKRQQEEKKKIRGRLENQDAYGGKAL